MAVTARDVLGCLFAPEEEVCFRVFDDKKGGVFSGAKLSCECGKYASIEELLERHNAMDRCVSFVVNYGGQDDSSIARVNAQFVDMDDGTIDEQQEKLDAFPLPPSMVVKTHRSLHAYWFMDGAAKVDRFRSVQKQLAEQFGGDPACVNESRAMRLPGFYHCKTGTPVEVECVSFHPERRYAQDNLSDALPEVEARPVERMSGMDRGLDAVMRSCDFLKHCRDDAASLSEHDWYAMITNLARFDGGTELIHELSAPYSGYNRNATQKKINHFLESGTGPMTCRTICDKGFKCPKLDTGECDVKSPAAWRFKPLSSEVLVEIIRGLPVTGRAIDDLQTARDFITDSLYNQDAVTADVIINAELRDHFNLKAMYIKSLTAAYKEASKMYQADKNVRRVKAGNTMPEWYEIGDRGIKFLPGVLAKRLSETEPVFYSAEQHYAYRGGVYIGIPEMEAQRMVQEKMLIRETRMSQITDAEKQWRLLVQKDIRELNPNPYIINLKNGLYNVLEDTLTEHTPEYYSTVQLNVSFVRDAECPEFRQFLEESMEGDMAQVKLIQEILGYFLIPVTVAQKGFVMAGAAAAGKSVLLKVVNELLLGVRNVSNVSWQALSDRFKTAELFGKLANIFADLPTKNIDDNGIFKALVGEDYLTVEKKNKDPFSFQSTARLLFSCNSIPKNYGDKSDGFYRRLIIIQFKHTVPPEERDPDLIEKFRAEADGIFQFALKGLYGLMENNFKFSTTKVNEDALQQYREESDSVLSFVKENCELSTDGSAGSTELYNAYKAYCEESGLRPCSQKAFVQQLTTAFGGIERGVDTLGKRRVLKGTARGHALLSVSDRWCTDTSDM